MGREVRRVAPDWSHPLGENGQYKPLYPIEMPQWAPDQATHLQIYETTTEGTPISPVMQSPEQLARWLVDHHANAFAGQTASYEAWLLVCKGQSSISGMWTREGVTNGVQYQHDEQDDLFDQATAKGRRKGLSR